MSFTVTLVFDGLFVFVHRTAPPTGEPRLHVLLARTPTDPPHATHKHRHSWRIMVDGVRTNMKGDHDWMAVGLEKKGTAVVPNALPLTLATGQIVTEQTLSGPFNPWQLEGRIVLPLPESAEPADPKEKVEVDWIQSSGTVKAIGKMTGRVSLKYTVKGSLKIPGLATITGAKTVTLIHLPEKPHRGKHPKGSPLGHAHMHAPIFDDKTAEFRTAEEYDGTKSASVDDPAGITGADPVICTPGNGCPPEDPHCNGS